MKKLLGIVVLGLLFCGNAYAKCINIMGNAKCTGGCVSGDSNLCEILQ